MDCLIMLCFACHSFFLSFFFACLLCFFLHANTCISHNTINSSAAHFFWRQQPNNNNNTIANKQICSLCCTTTDTICLKCVYRWQIRCHTHTLDIVSMCMPVFVCVCVMLWMKIHTLNCTTCCCWMNEKRKQTWSKTTKKFNVQEKKRHRTNQAH